jgi:hypothetical protein
MPRQVAPRYWVGRATASKTALKRPHSSAIEACVCPGVSPHTHTHTRNWESRFIQNNLIFLVTLLLRYATVKL